MPLVNHWEEDEVCQGKRRGKIKREGNPGSHRPKLKWPEPIKMFIWLVACNKAGSPQALFDFKSVWAEKFNITAETLWLEVTTKFPWFEDYVQHTRGTPLLPENLLNRLDNMHRCRKKSVPGDYVSEYKRSIEHPEHPDGIMHYFLQNKELMRRLQGSEKMSKDSVFNYTKNLRLQFRISRLAR